jgi:CRISPR-associated protein Cmr3
MFDHGQIDRVKRDVSARGPLLVELVDDAKQMRLSWLAPAPADALLLSVDDKTRAKILQLVPIASPQGATYGQVAGTTLALIGLRAHFAEKLLPAPPRFWHWDAFANWLLTPQEGERMLAEVGLAGPTAEIRMHVGIDPEAQTSFEGLLFQTAGLEFTGPKRRRLALAVATDTTFQHFAGGLAPLGGERRLVAWRQIDTGLPACPAELRKRIVERRACRVVLLTPGYFTAGFRPTWLLEPHAGVAATLQAALVGRPQVVSGWDLAAERITASGRREFGAPKPIRRLAPSGSVFFLSLPKDVDTEAIDKWIDCLWMQNVSDDDASRSEGFGLAALGVWSGELEPMEVN